MPCLDISTNVSLDGINLQPFFSEATTAVAAIMGKPESFIMVAVKGSVAMQFGGNGNKEPAALAEIVSIDAVDRVAKRRLIAEIGTILEDRLSIPRTRFVLKVFNPATTRSKL